MTQPRLQTVVHHLREMVNAQERVADAELLSRFATRRDESAFTMLVQRHGPMVLGVCRRMLKRPADAEDAWQATFLVLARKARAIRKQASVAAWLHGVALRICQRTREKVQREKHGELPVDLLEAKSDDLSWREVQRILDEEIERLPERLRQPIVLCYLEGRTRDEAAEELGWTLSTFRGRLDMARERLRKSLIKRGLTLPAALLATLLSQAGEASAIPQASMEALLPAVISGSASASLLPLVEGGIRAMSTSKMPSVVSMFLAASLIIGGSAYFGHKPAGNGTPTTLAAAEPSTNRPKDEPNKVDANTEAERLKDLLAHADRLQLDFQLYPTDPKGIAYPLRYVMLNVLPIPIEPHGKWPNGTPIGADARISKEQAGKIVTALAKLGVLKNASGAIPEFHRNGPYAAITLRYRPDGAMENKQLWLPLDWDLKMVRHLQAIRGCVDGAAAKHLDAMLTSLEADRKKWEADGLSLDNMQGRWRLIESEWKGRGWPLAEGMSGTLNIKATSKAIPYYEENLKIEIAANSSASAIAAARANLARVIAEDGQIEVSLIAGKNNKGGILDADWQFNGKVVFEAPPELPLYFNDRADLAEGRWIILRGRWTTNGSDGTKRYEPVWYHPTKHLLRIGIPGQQAVYLVFQRDEVNWGEESQELAIRARAVKTQFNSGEQPNFEIDLRNRSPKAWQVTAVPPLVEVEVDGKWYTFSDNLDSSAAIRNVKANEQIDKWITVSPDKGWGHGGDTDEPRKALEWTPGKHKVRLAYSIQGKVHLHSRIFEIEIAGQKVGGWGEQADGVQLRLWTARPNFRSDEIPALSVDVFNGRKGDLKVAAMPEDFTIELDGTTYRYAGAIDRRVKDRIVKPGERIESWQTILPGNKWIRAGKSSEAVPLEWKPGKHIVRVGYLLENKTPMLSNFIEFNVIDAKTLGWGKARDGLQLRARATKPTWNIGEQPKFEIDLRNSGVKDWKVTAIPPHTLVELDGDWYSYKLPLSYPAAEQELKAGATFDKWYTVAPNNDWTQDDFVDKPVALEWKPGKHRLRFGYPIKGKQLVPVSEVVEIEIVDPKDTGWGQPDNGVRIRLGTTKKVWSTAEAPILQIDVGNERSGELIVDNQPTCSITVDGLGYDAVFREKLITGQTQIGPGTTRLGYFKFALTEAMLRTSAKVDRPHPLGPGKHTITVSCEIDKYRPVSNAIEIEIVDAKEVGWGKPSDGYEARLTIKQNVYMPGDVPEFTLDIRNRGTREFDTLRSPSLVQIELDGLWYFQPTPRLGFPSHKIKANGSVDRWAEFNLLDNSWHRSNPTDGKLSLDLKPGKHRIRAAYEIAQNVRPISEVVEFEIIDANATGWGKADGQFRARLRAAKKVCSGDEVPVLTLDLSNSSKEDRVVEMLATEIEVNGMWYFLPKPDILPPSRKIEAGQQIDKWEEVRLEPKAWRRSAQDWIGPAALQLAPGKYTIRAAYPVGKEIRPISEPIEIEIVDPKEVGWGEAVGGIQVRARKQPFKYVDQDTFKFELDVRSQRKDDIKTQRLSENTELEVDGVWYESPTVWSFYFPKEPIEVTLKAGETFPSFATIVLHGHWYEKTPLGQVRPDKPVKIDLKPGKHIVRLSYPLKPNLRPISEPLEIEIVDAKDVGWGPAVGGLQLRGRSTKTAWMLGDKPEFVLDLRSRGTALEDGRINEHVTQIEVDGVWYETIDPYFYLSFGRYDLKANGQIDNWLTVPIGNAWCHFADGGAKRTPLEWKPGKHQIRLRYEFTLNNKPTTLPFEITILDPKEIGWGDASGGVQLRGRATKPTYNLGEVPAIELDIRNRGTATNERDANHFATWLEVNGKIYSVFDASFYGGQPTTRTKLKPNDQIDKWFTFQAGSNSPFEWHDPVDQKAKRLDWKAGNYKVRIGYPLAEKVKPMTDFIEFEIVDPKRAGDWGDAVGDIQLRVRAANPNRRADIPPAFYIDVRNVGNTEVTMGRFPLLSEVEVDGRWYHAPFGLIGFPSEKIKAGDQIDRFVEIRLDEGTWKPKANSEERAPLTLTSGKHKLRVAYRMQHVQGKPTSQPIEFTVADGKDAGWGEAVEGLQLRGRSTQTLWNAGQSPRFEIDIRNTSDKEWQLMGVPAKTHIEIDKRWYACAFEVKQVFPAHNLKLGDYLGKWISITPDFTFKTPNFVEDPSRKIEWTAGKHRIRLAYEIKDGVKPITAEFEIEIVDTTPRAWKHKETIGAPADRSGVGSLHFSPNGKLLLTTYGGLDGPHVYQTEYLKLIRSVSARRVGFWFAGFTKNNDAVTVSTNALEVPENSRFYFTNLLKDTNELIWETNQRPGFITLSPDGKYFATGEDFRLQLRSIAEKGKVIQTFGDSKTAVTAYAFSPDGSKIAIGTYQSEGLGGDIALWDVKNGKRLAVAPLKATPNRIVFTKDRLFVITEPFHPKTVNCRLQWFETEKLRELGALDGPAEGEFKWISAFAASPDGRTAAIAWTKNHNGASSGDKIILYETEAKKELPAPHGSEKQIRALAFSPDGKILAVGTDDGIIGLWQR